MTLYTRTPISNVIIIKKCVPCKPVVNVGDSDDSFKKERHTVKQTDKQSLVSCTYINPS